METNITDTEIAAAFEGTNFGGANHRRLLEQDYLEIIKLLSALESWSFSTGGKFPDYLGEQIIDSIEKLSKEVLK